MLESYSRIKDERYREIYYMSPSHSQKNDDNFHCTPNDHQFLLIRFFFYLKNVFHLFVKNT